MFFVILAPRKQQEERRKTIPDAMFLFNETMMTLPIAKPG
jgi:hypothetical protein